MELTRPVVDRLTRGAPGMRVMNFPNNSWKHFLLTNNETRVSGFYWMGPVLCFYRPCNHLIFSIFKDFSHYTVYGHWFYLGTKKKKVPIQKNPKTRVSLFVRRKFFPLLLRKFMTHIPGAPLVSWYDPYQLLCHWHRLSGIRPRKLEEIDNLHFAADFAVCGELGMGLW